MQTVKGTGAPEGCQLGSSLYLFPKSFHREDKWWRALPGEGGNVHSNILSGAYACASICGSGTGRMQPHSYLMFSAVPLADRKPVFREN